MGGLYHIRLLWKVLLWRIIDSILKTNETSGNCLTSLWNVVRVCHLYSICPYFGSYILRKIVSEALKKGPYCTVLYYLPHGLTCSYFPIETLKNKYCQKCAKPVFICVFLGAFPFGQPIQINNHSSAPFTFRILFLVHPLCFALLHCVRISVYK